MKCSRCKKEFDPSMDFIENEEACEAVMFFADTDNLCSSCGWDLIDYLSTQSAKFIINEVG